VEEREAPEWLLVRRVQRAIQASGLGEGAALFLWCHWPARRIIASLLAVGDLLGPGVRPWQDILADDRAVRQLAEGLLEPAPSPKRRPR